MSNSSERSGEELLPCPFCGRSGHQIGEIYGMKRESGEKVADYYVGCVCGARGTSVDDIRHVPAAWNTRIPTPVTPGWISVKERLPEPGKSVDVWCNPFQMTQFRIPNAYLTKDGRWAEDGGEYIGGVTHWMLLPAAPDSDTETAS